MEAREGVGVGVVAAVVVVVHGVPRHIFFFLEHVLGSRVRQLFFIRHRYKIELKI